MLQRTIGREASCDLVIEDASVARRHASTELAADGSVYVTSLAPSARLRLHRNGHWIEAHRVSLCVEDRIRLGDAEVPLAQVTGLFGAGAGARLRPRPAAPPRLSPGEPGADPQPERRAGPRRNPHTGSIED